MIAVVTGVGLFVFDYLQSANLDALYLLVVFTAALKWGRLPALFAAVTSIVIFDFCFVSPRFSFAFSDMTYLVTFAVFAIVALLTSEIAVRAHEAIETEAARAHSEALLVAKERILNTVSHELRGPMTTILGWVQILRAKSGDARVTEQGMAALERNAKRLARLADDLLDASRIQAGKLGVQLEPLDVAPVVTRALEDAAIAASEKGVHFEANIQSVGTILGDEHRIEQIVTNLIANAIKFTPAGGTVTVNLYQLDRRVELAVSDTGDGIAPEFLPHVFERFAQAPRQGERQGLGLGLAIVKHLVDAHRGTIHVESAGCGQGARFTVGLPLV